jgi:hypothetical protein
MSRKINLVTEITEAKPETAEMEIFLCDLGSKLCALCVHSGTK